MIAQHRLQKNYVVVGYSYFEGERGYAGCVPQIWDWEANYCSHILHYIAYIRDQGQNRSCQWSSVKNCTKPTCAGLRPDPLAGVRGLIAPSLPLPKNPHPASAPRALLDLGPSGLGSPFVIPWKKLADSHE